MRTESHGHAEALRRLLATLTREREGEQQHETQEGETHQPGHEGPAGKAQ